MLIIPLKILLLYQSLVTLFILLWRTNGNGIQGLIDFHGLNIFYIYFDGPSFFLIYFYGLVRTVKVNWPLLDSESQLIRFRPWKSNISSFHQYHFNTTTITVNFVLQKIVDFHPIDNIMSMVTLYYWQNCSVVEFSVHLQLSLNISFLARY